MQKVIEPLGFLIYMTLLLYMGIYIYRNHYGTKVHMVFGSMAITLAIAESIYFIPRIYGLITTGLEENLLLLGWGRIGHLLVITLFFSMFIDLKKESFGIKKKIPLDKLLYGLLIFRVAIGLLPQNQYFQLEGNRTFLLLRTVPLIVYLLIIALVIVLYSLKKGEKDMVAIAIMLIPLGFLVNPNFVKVSNYSELAIKAVIRCLLLLGIVFIGFKEVRKSNELKRF